MPLQMQILLVLVACGRVSVTGTVPGNLVRYWAATVVAYGG
jgi:hypothetical protein